MCDEIVSRVCYAKSETPTSSSLSEAFASRRFAALLERLRFALRYYHTVTVVFTFLHSIATSRCRKTEWLLCGAHIVLAARSSLVRGRT